MLMCKGRSFLFMHFFFDELCSRCRYMEFQDGKPKTKNPFQSKNMTKLKGNHPPELLPIIQQQSGIRNK